MQSTPELKSFCKQFNDKHKNLRMYLRNRKNQFVGMLLAYRDGDTVKFGWSKCMTKLDVFHKDSALYIAAHRAAKKNTSLSNLETVLSVLEDSELPHLVKKLAPKFVARAKRYFRLPVE